MQVKAAAALLLLLVVMSDEPARIQLAEAGTATIVYAQLLQAALAFSSQLESEAATSHLLRAGQLDAESSTQVDSALLSSVDISLPFLAASKALVLRLCGSGVSFVTRMQSLSTYTACTAISQCKWTPTAASVPQPTQNIFMRATGWLRKRSKFDSRAEKVGFGMLRASSIARMGLFDDDSLDSVDQLLSLAEQLQLCLKLAEDFVAKTQAQASASAVDSLESCLKRSATLMERHTMTRYPVSVLLLYVNSLESRLKRSTTPMQRHTMTRYPVSVLLLVVDGLESCLMRSAMPMERHTMAG